jgi:hypothetical protein
VIRQGLVLVVAAAALAGCGGDGGGSGSSGDGTALAQSLGSVKAGDASKAYFEWGDTERLAGLAGVPPDGGEASGDERFLLVSAIGLGNLGTTSVTLAEVSGIKPFGADEVVSIGTAPRTATRLTGSGVEASAADPKLREAGAKPISVDGHELLALGEEGNAGNDRLDEFGVGLGRDFDRVAIEDSSITMGPYEDPVLELIDGSPALGDEPDYAAGASCLGDVSYAVMAPPTDETPLGEVPGSPALVAIGGRISDSKEVDEVVCVVYADEDAARGEADVLRKSIAPSALLQSSRTRLSDRITETEVDTVSADGRSVARAVLSLKPDAPPSLVYDAFIRADLAFLLGAPAGPVEP